MTAFQTGGCRLESIRGRMGVYFQPSRSDHALAWNGNKRRTQNAEAQKQETGIDLAC